MNITYNKQELKQIITDLSVLLEANICFIDIYFNFILESGEVAPYCALIQKRKLVFEKCKHHDDEILRDCQKTGTMQIRMCHGGLCNVAMPVIKNDIVAGYILIGCLRTPSSPKVPPYITDKDNKLLQRYEEQSLYSESRLESFMKLLPHILFQNAITIEYDGFISKAVDYISVNLEKNLSVANICKQLNVSKNYLYASFREYYGCTVNEFITTLRIKKAKQMLLETSEPIYRIAELIGIENYTYFCKLFKKKNGISPGDFRRLK